MKKLIILCCSIATISRGEDKHFVIDICSFNNAQWYEKNLDSVLTQDYPYYRVIYTDDASSDGTGELVERYIEKHEANDKILLIKNTQRRRALANHYRAIHLCRDHEIILTLDGDDFLADSHVLSLLNTLYTTHDIWLAYSRFVNWPQPGSSNAGCEYSRPIAQKIIDQGAYRSGPWVYGQLRSFYAWLAKCIKLEDLLLSVPLTRYHTRRLSAAVEKMTMRDMKRAIDTTHSFQGTFFPSAGDVALMMPMLEMIDGRFIYIDEPLYLRNVATYLNDHKVDPSMQNYCALYVRSLPRYQPLTTPMCHEHAIEQQAVTAVVLNTCNTQDDLDEHVACLRTLPGIDHIYVLGVARPEEAAVTFIPEKSCAVLEDVVQKSTVYVLITQGNEKFKHKPDLRECSIQLEQTYAHAFYFEKPKQLIMYDRLFATDTFFWQYVFQKPRATAALYRRETIERALYTTTSLDEWWDQIPLTAQHPRSIGLFIDAVC